MAAPLLPIIMGLAQFAPQVMRYFGAGDTSTAVAEKVMGIAQAVAGTESPQQALERIAANATLQHEFKLRLLESTSQLDQLHLADRQDARRRDVDLARLGQHNTRADVMVAGAVVGLLACLAVLVFFKDKLPGEVVGIVSTVAGIFGACLRDAFQFEFGSSRGSRDKDELLARKNP